MVVLRSTPGIILGLVLAMTPLAGGTDLEPEPAPVVGKARPGSDWPAFLGPTADGKSPETGILTKWDAGGPPLLWHIPVGEGYAAPSVADGRLFLFDRHGSRARLMALDAVTGRELWRTEYPTAYEDMYGFSNGPRAAPTVDGGRVYTFGAGGRLRCLSVKDGALLWEVDTSAKFNVVQNFFGAGSAPVVAGDLLIAGIGGSPPGSPGIQSGEVVGNGSGLVAFDKRTGDVRYTATDELASYSTPKLATMGERRWGFWLARGGLVGFEPASGKVDFRFPFRARKLESVNASNPIVAGDTVFITESYGRGSALLRVRPGGYEVVRQDVSPRNQSMSCHFMTPVHHQGILYGSHGMSSGEAELRAVDLRSGEVKWRKPGLERVTLLHADGHLVIYTERGRLLLVKADPVAYQAVAEAVPLLPGEVDRPLLAYPAWSPPVLARGILYLRAKGRLAAFELIPPGG